MAKFLKHQFPVSDILTMFSNKDIVSFRAVSGMELFRTRNINLFLLKGITCDVCGVKVDHFKVKKNKANGKIDYSLTPINTNGTEMTRDHVEAKCNGGANEFANLVPMCQPCNGKWKSRFDKMEKINSKIINLTMKDFIE